MSSLTHFPTPILEERTFFAIVNEANGSVVRLTVLFTWHLRKTSLFFVVGRNAVGRLVPDAYETKNRNLYEGVEHAQIFQR